MGNENETKPIPMWFSLSKFLNTDSSSGSDDETFQSKPTKRQLRFETMTPLQMMTVSLQQKCWSVFITILTRNVATKPGRGSVKSVCV